jgi:hypothetical protein
MSARTAAKAIAKILTLASLFMVFSSSQYIYLDIFENLLPLRQARFRALRKTLASKPGHSSLHTPL